MFQEIFEAKYEMPNLASLTITVPPSSSSRISSRSLLKTSKSSLNHCREGFGVPSTFTLNSTCVLWLVVDMIYMSLCLLTFSCSKAMVSFNIRTK